MERAIKAAAGLCRFVSYFCLCWRNIAQKDFACRVAETCYVSDVLAVACQIGMINPVEPPNRTRITRDRIRRDVAELREALGNDVALEVELRLNDLDSDLETYFALTSEP